MLTALVWLLFVGVLVAAIWAVYRTPPQMTLTREVARSGFAGSRMPLTVRAHLSSALPMRVTLHDQPPRGVVPDVMPAVNLLLLGTAEVSVPTLVTLNRRGEFHWAGATLAWADPLGLFWRTTTVGEPTSLTVFPTTHGLVLPDLLRPLLSEGSLSRTLGLEDPISLRGAREYVFGDPPGRVHWRLSARSGQLMVRELERMAASSLTVYLDLSGANDMYVESAVRLAASLIREAGELELPVSIATNAGATPAGRQRESLHAALSALAAAQPSPEAPVIPPTQPGGNLIILTARAGDALIQQAMRARAQASRVSIIAMPEGFYLEPGETPRRQWAGLPETVRELERMAGTLAGSGVLVYVLRGNQSVLRLGT